MSKINCSLIKDLLPLYIDDLCSKETTEIVGNHLEICEDCNKEYETLKTEPKVKPQQDNSQELIKKVNKRFGKDKKKAVIKTISIFLVVFILVGVIAFFKVPLYMAEYDFKTSGVSYPLNYEEWEICNITKANFTHEAADLYIDEKYGEYEIIDKNDVVQLKFDDGKIIAIYYIDFDSIPTFEENENFFNNMRDCYFFLTPVIKKGLENLGVNTEVGVGYCLDLEVELIKNFPPDVKLFSSYDEYAKACAYYGCFTMTMPVVDGHEYYVLGESEDFIAWGWTAYRENLTNYLMQYQSKDDLKNCCSIQVSGFTKEEAQEIFKYAVIK